MVHDIEHAPPPAREGHNANRARHAEGDPRESTLPSGSPTASWPQYPDTLVWLGRRVVLCEKTLRARSDLGNLDLRLALDPGM